MFVLNQNVQSKEVRRSVKPANNQASVDFVHNRDRKVVIAKLGYFSQCADLCAVGDDASDAGFVEERASARLPREISVARLSGAAGKSQAFRSVRSREAGPRRRRQAGRTRERSRGCGVTHPI